MNNRRPLSERILLTAEEIRSLNHTLASLSSDSKYRKDMEYLLNLAQKRLQRQLKQQEATR